MTEPIYSYVKGKGWVVSTTETYVTERRVGAKKYKITIMKRSPKESEHGWYFPKLDFPNNMVTEEIDIYRGNKFGWVANGKEPNYQSEILCTLETELIE